MLTRMQICWLWLLISFGNHALAATDCAVQTDIPQSQCQALVDLYNSTGGGNERSWFWEDYNPPGDYWNTTNTPCQWKGITCNGGVVTEIFIIYRYLNGDLPNSLVNLTGLTHLFLSNNQLTGTIPTLPSSLTYLNLSYNQLTGTIPTLPAGLTFLDLSGNKLQLTTAAITGGTDCAVQTQIPQIQCQALVDLYNSMNTIDWSSSFGNNQNVTNTPCSWVGVTCSGNIVTGISLPYSHLTGTFTLPNSLVNLTGLTSLNLSGNGLTGTIPILPTGLISLNLSHNQLTGTIPTLPVGLTRLYLSYNQLTGTIPTLPVGLTRLYLSYNQLTGTILTLPTGLTELDLSNNQLTGIIPTLSTVLGYLNLSNNQLTGTIPTLPTGLTHLFLSNNQLTGTIPTLPTGLISLYLSDNPLTGTLPILPAGLRYINLNNTFVSVASSSSVPVAPSNDGIASEIMSNYGQVADNLTVTETGSVSGGTLTGTITNKGLIANATIAPQAILSGGKLSGFNVNQGTITDVTLSQYAQISGGNYAGIIHNYGSLLNPTILEKTDISGGQLAGVVFNQGTVHDVAFAPQTQVIGGKLTGTLIGSAESVVIIGEAELDAAKIGNACLTVTTQVSQTVELKNTVQHTAIDFTQLTPEDFCIQPQNIANFTAQRLAATEKLAFSSFTAQQVAELPTAALSVLSAAQLAQISSEALQGFSVEQFQAIPIEALSGLHKDNMGGLSPHVIHSVDQKRLQALTATEFQQMPGYGVAKWLTNLDINQTTPELLYRLLPENWKFDETTGSFTAPVNTQLALRDFNPKGLMFPKYVFDVNTGLSIGGDGKDDTLIQKINQVLILEGQSYRIEQDIYAQGIIHGILLNDNSPNKRRFAFLPNSQGLWQRDKSQSVGVQLKENERYQITTTDNIEVNLLPAPKDPIFLNSVLRGSRVIIGEQGEIFISFIQANDNLLNNFIALFNPFVEIVPSTEQYGLYFLDGARAKRQAKLIYYDGTAQVLYPTVFSPKTLIEEAKKFPGVESVTFNMDGTFEVMYQGQKLQLFPNFDVKVTPLKKYEHVKPSVTLKGNTLEYQVQHGQQLLTSELSFDQ